MREVIYLTGPPASGKTTLIKRLKKSLPNIEIFIYSELLANHITQRSNKQFSQKRLRKQSATVVSPEDIEKVDSLLLDRVANCRKERHVIIDSHPVTKEIYGFRVTAFSVPLLLSLKPTRVCMLFTTPQSVRRRIATDPKGRPMVTTFEANFHCFAQASVAVTYGIQLGIPVYFYDTSKNVDVAFAQLASRLR